MGSDLRKYDEDADMEEILFSEDVIRDRIGELGATISADYSDGGLSVVGVATGAFMFLADLVRSIRVPMEVDLIRAQSYGQGTESSGSVRISGELKINLKGRHVLLVEDILDTGRTLGGLVEYLQSQQPASISVCVLLDKACRRVVPLSLPQGRLYTGFECPDYFVVGYGLDFGEKYRGLPYVGVLKPELYAHIK